MATQTAREKTLLALTIGLAIGLVFAGVGLFGALGLVKANTARVTALEHRGAITQSDLRSTEQDLADSERRQVTLDHRLEKQRTYSIALARQVRTLGATPVSFVSVNPPAQQTSHDRQKKQPTSHHSHHPAPKPRPKPTPSPSPTRTCIAGIICLPGA